MRTFLLIRPLSLSVKIKPDCVFACVNRICLCVVPLRVFFCVCVNIKTLKQEVNKNECYQFWYNLFAVWVQLEIFRWLDIATKLTTTVKLTTIFTTNANTSNFDDWIFHIYFEVETVVRKRQKLLKENCQKNENKVKKGDAHTLPNKISYIRPTRKARIIKHLSPHYSNFIKLFMEPYAFWPFKAKTPMVPSIV